MQGKKGFSFIELILILVFFFIILASLMPMITRRHLAPPERANHGTYACYWERKEDGTQQLKQTLVRGRKTIIKNADTAECTFDPPKQEP